MSSYLGDFDEDGTVDFLWGSFDSDGASITRATNGTISVYKDNGTTQSTAGITDTEDFDSLTGVHACTIDLSADAFYATGANYSVVLSGATIDGQTVNTVLREFSIQNRYMRGTDSANTTTPPTVTAIRAEMDSNSTQLADIVADTAEIGTAGAGLTNIAWNASWDAEVQSEVTDALNAYDPPTKAELDSGLAGLNDLSAAAVNAEVVDAIATDARSEPGSVPAANAAMATKVDWLFALARNKITQTSSTQTLRNDADSGDIGSASVSDDGTTFTRGEFS